MNDMSVTTQIVLGIVIFLVMLIMAGIVALVIYFVRARRRATATTTPTDHATHTHVPTQKTGGFWGGCLWLLGFTMALVILFVVVWYIYWASWAVHKLVKTSYPTQTQTTTTVANFPIRGSGNATKDAPVKAYLNPLRVHTRPSGPARYVLAENTEVFFDHEDNPSTDPRWWSMPPGNYLVYPRGVDKVTFTWWVD